MILNEIKQSYIKQANNIKNWRTMNKNDLANKYLEYEHIEPERSHYFAALMCRYWSTVYNYYRTSKGTRLSIEDFTTWLADSFFVAFKYKRWKDPTHKLYNDPQAPDKVINRCIYSVRMRYYRDNNTDKRKVNFITDSIERQLESFGHLATVNEYLATTDIDESEELCRNIIKEYIKLNDLLSAVILDVICFQDSFVSKKSLKGTIYSFSLTKLMRELRNINESYSNYLMLTYNISKQTLEEFFQELKELISNNQLLELVKQKISLLNNEKIRDTLCL